jgi:hypothetical protein
MYIKDKNFRVWGFHNHATFFGIGKKSMFKALKETPNQLSDLSRIECSDIDDSVDLSRKLISRLYDPRGKSTLVDILIV